MVANSILYPSANKKCLWTVPKSPRKQNHSQLKTLALNRQAHKCLYHWILKFLERLIKGLSRSLLDRNFHWRMFSIWSSLYVEIPYTYAISWRLEKLSAVQCYEVELLSHMILRFRWISMVFLFTWIFIMFLFILTFYYAYFFFKWDIMLW